MDSVVIIGNGFDLAHGIKTSYNDFIVWYLNKTLQNLQQKRNYEDELVSFSRKNDATIFTIDSIEKFYSFLKSIETDFKVKNLFLETLLKQTLLNKWVDIEREYYSAIVGQYIKLEKNDIIRHIGIDENVKSINKAVELIKLALAEYLSIIEAERITKIERIENHFKSICAEGQQGSIRNKILILNFNYTKTVELYKDVFKPNKHLIINIHGQLNNVENPIIFGYGDESDYYYEKIERLNNNEFLKNFKSFYYLKTHNYKKIFNFINPGDFYKVYIMGHSCGLSDKILLNKLFESPKCTDIQILYHQRSKDDTDYFEKTQEISRHFSSANKALMREKIVSFPSCNPL